VCVKYGTPTNCQALKKTGLRGDDFRMRVKAGGLDFGKKGMWDFGS
jgi:hypothetical protein